MGMLVRFYLYKSLIINNSRTFLTVSYILIWLLKDKVVDAALNAMFFHG